jgi:predicted flavoprotein YhiN
MLQLSSHWKPGETISLDLAPGRDLQQELLGWKSTYPRTLLRSHLDRTLPHKLVLELETLFWPERAQIPLSAWPDRELDRLAAKLQGWYIKPAGTEGYRKAEVTLGGVDTRALSSKTMESSVPGLFFLGEVVDVSGQLGGFNFQWAWSSGHAAGEAL